MYYVIVRHSANKMYWNNVSGWIIPSNNQRATIFHEFPSALRQLLQHAIPDTPNRIKIEIEEVKV